MKSLNRTRVGLLLGAAACAALLTPLSCGDDTTSPAPEDAAADTKVDSSTPDTGSKMDVTTTDTKADTPQESASEAEAAAAETGGGDADAGPMMDASDASDGSDASEDAPDGDGGPQCGNPADSTMSRACVVFTGTDQVTPVTLPDGAATDLDNMGTLLIYAFAVPNPSNGGADGGAALPIAQPIAIPPPDDAGIFITEMPVSGLTSLPPIPIDVPAAVTTAYIVSYFVDNKGGFNAIAQGTLTYGMYVGGINLAQGIEPVPPLNAVTLTAGQETLVKQYLTVMREFQTVVVRAAVLPDGGLLPPAPGGDGTGPLAVGAYHTHLPDSMRVYGGALATCVDIVHDEPYPITGFFYTPTMGQQVWFGADLNDFGDTANTPPHGSLVSAIQDDAGTAVLPDQQSLMVGANDYAVILPGIGLTAPVLPAPATDFVHCPFPPPDAGSDASGD